MPEREVLGVRTWLLLLGPVALAAVVATGAATAAASAPPRCRTSVLSVRLGPADGALGTIYRSIVFTSHARAACSLRGHPGVSYVAGSRGRQVGPAADWDPGTSRTIVLAPGRSAYAVLRERETFNYPAAACRPAAVRGIRVYPPGSRAAVFLPWAHHVCSRAVGQTGVRPVAKGTG
jgi:hypothetical protein